MTISLRDLVTNPATGRLSTSDTIVFLAFLVSSFVLVWITVTRPETPGELYLSGRMGGTEPGIKTHVH